MRAETNRTWVVKVVRSGTQEVPVATIKGLKTPDSYEAWLKYEFEPKDPRIVERYEERRAAALATKGKSEFEIAKNPPKGPGCL